MSFRALFLGLLLTLAALGTAGQKVVCIDPGHPSEVGSGTQGKKITEIAAAWKVALLLKAKLEKQGVKVVMTKNSEKQFVKNKARAETANGAHADYMVRLHCDSSSGTGFACYIPEKQGKSQGTTGPSQQVIAGSKAFGARFHKALAEALKGKLKDNGLLPDTATAVGGKQGALTGSVFSKVPVILIEMVVLTNPKDEAFMVSKEGQEQMAEALAKATMAAIGD